MRHAADEGDLEGADQALGVPRLDARRRSRVEAPHPSIELAGAALGRDAIEHRPQRLVPGRPREQAADERAEVEAGAADEDRQRARAP